MLGIAAGLLTALAQSISYLCSRHLVSHRGWSLRQLLVLAHVWMGLMALLLLPLTWHAQVPSWRQWALPLTGVTLFYLLGQTSLFYALRYTEASRVAPLLGIKLVMLALAAVVLLGQALALGQWLAVGLATTAALLLNQTGGRLPTRAIVAILLACVGYTGSDLCISVLNQQLQSPGTPTLQVAMLGASLSYLLSGLIGAVLLPWHGERRPQRWLAALPYALAWFVAMLGMYAAISLAGVVLANILQSTRGLMSVALGALLAGVGLVHLESKATRSVLIRRLIAAGLMTLAVGLYVYYRPALR
mgnify:CR=1 FL=1